MSTAVIRYQTTPEAADENQHLIENVFAELALKAPAGLRYSSFRLDDGVSFLHVATGGEALQDLPAFQEFQRDLADRLADGPHRTEATEVGRYVAQS